MDPRIYQISALAGLLIYGWGCLDFEISAAQVAVTLGGVLAAQWGCARIWKVERFEARSALISGLSLCLLLRTNHLALALAGAVITIASKFAIRVRGKHVFNPTNFGLLVMMIATDGAVWISPGQWGSAAFFGFLIACLGGLVVMRAARSDVTLAFLAFYLALVFGRSFWLGEPMGIPQHRLQSGALLLFAFFMISDPRTTPDSRAGRILFAALVAAGAWYVQFRLFRSNGLLWSLALFSPAVPLLDHLLSGTRHRWPMPDSAAAPNPFPQPQPNLP